MHHRNSTQTKSPKWHRMWRVETTTDRRSFHFYDALPVRRLIPLKDAARLTYERTRSTDMAKMAERPYDGKVDILGYYATWLLDREIPVYAIREPIDRHERIPLSEQERLHAPDDVTKLIGVYGTERPYLNPLVLKRDLRRILAE